MRREEITPGENAASRLGGPIGFWVTLSAAGKQPIPSWAGLARRGFKSRARASVPHLWGIGGKSYRSLPPKAGRPGNNVVTWSTVRLLAELLGHIAFGGSFVGGSSQPRQITSFFRNSALAESESSSSLAEISFGFAALRLTVGGFDHF